LTGAFDIDVRPVDVKSTLPPLDGIPQSFFDTSFDLADPATWADITGQPATSAPTDISSPGAAFAQQLQESLSTHLDTLERHLIHEITLRSTSFFSALSNLQDLHSESSSCLSRIRELQAGLRDIGENTAQRGLGIIDKHEDLDVLRATEQGLEELEELEGVMDVTRTFVEADDWLGGLGCLGEIGAWWVRHLPRAEAAEEARLDGAALAPDELSHLETQQAAAPTPVRLPLRLSTLPALSPLPQLFSDLRTQIALQIEASLHSYLLTTLSSADVGLHPDDNETSKALGANGGDATRDDQTARDYGSGYHVDYDAARFKEHVTPMIEGLARCGVLDGIEGLWSDVVTLAVREGSRKVRTTRHDDACHMSLCMDVSIWPGDWAVRSMPELWNRSRVGQGIRAAQRAERLGRAVHICEPESSS
jgi:vacuolar protein sorting-associated protein 54